jgi:hypothetical protein
VDTWKPIAKSLHEVSFDDIGITPVDYIYYSHLPLAMAAHAKLLFGIPLAFSTAKRDEHTEKAPKPCRSGAGHASTEYGQKDISKEIRARPDYR